MSVMNTEDGICGSGDSDFKIMQSNIVVILWNDSPKAVVPYWARLNCCLFAHPVSTSFLNYSFIRDLVTCKMTEGNNLVFKWFPILKGVEGLCNTFRM